MKRINLALLIVGTVTFAVFAQSAQGPAFQVASVRPSIGGTPASQKVAETRLDFVNTPLRSVLLTAFRVEAFQLSAPNWLNELRFDIHATYPSDARKQVPEMLQRLLIERFGLVTHIQPQPLEAYELVVSTDGLRIREVEAVNDLDKDFTKESAAGRISSDRVMETANGPVRTMLVPDQIGTRTVTTRSLYLSRTTSRQTTEIDASRITMGEFSRLLQVNLDRPVIDKTALTGVYQFKVELDRSVMAARVLSNLPPDRQRALTEPTGVSTFRAVENLGLRLEERRSPIDVLVVDKIERTPTPD